MVRNRKKNIFFCFFLRILLIILSLLDCPRFTKEYGDTIAISGCVLKSGGGLLMMLFGLFPNDFKTRYLHVVYLGLDLPFKCTTSWKRWIQNYFIDFWAWRGLYWYKFLGDPRQNPGDWTIFDCACFYFSACSYKVHASYAHTPWTHPWYLCYCHLSHGFWTYVTVTIACGVLIFMVEIAIIGY